MTDADEALLWARGMAKQLREAPNDPTRDLAQEIDVGWHDDELSDIAHAYRAGVAASAERIKELEARIKELEALVQPPVMISGPGNSISITIPGRIFKIPYTAHLDGSPHPAKRGGQ